MRQYQVSGRCSCSIFAMMSQHCSDGDDGDGGACAALLLHRFAFQLGRSRAYGKLFALPKRNWRLLPAYALGAGTQFQQAEMQDANQFALQRCRLHQKPDD